ncbi:MAG: tRNA (guanine(10)-N(2))-dimethyltransferase [Candidatus Hadarchaeum sp.]|uniref:tRNA (guanine(10)-N(2))-dimethyltransferase n=1 Tax=Candidatus Hadarchaeum sp. TaxID=2883567 RepID=UPI00317168C9
MRTILITEGKTKVESPNPEDFKTGAGDYAPSLTKVFYNPNMELCRDISISVAQVTAQMFNRLYICDPLAGIGIRGLRYANEVKGVARCVVNDKSMDAFELIKRNAELNGLSNSVEASLADANIILLQNRGKFNFVDLDPFGSPAPFLDAACSSLSRRGMLALTATDTAPLSGTYPKTCLRRYGAKPLKTEYCHEIGIRILIGFAQRIGGLHEIALTPVLVHATRHYFRIYLQGQRGAQRADELLKEMGYISHCNACMRRKISYGLITELPEHCECGRKYSHAGPLWTGKLADKRFIQEVIADLSERNFGLKHQEISLLCRCAEEADGPPTFYDLNRLAGFLKKPTPKMGELISAIRSNGYFASRTHFSNTGFRTDAPIEEILKIIENA